MSKYKAIKVNGIKYDEHRYLMEQYLGRKLNRNEVVHHKNGNKLDNRLENLEVKSLSEHSREHQIAKIVSEKTKQKISEALKGHKSPRRKFSEDQIKQIKNLHEKGFSNRKIAALFNAGHQTIADIINNKTYRN